MQAFERMVHVVERLTGVFLAQLLHFHTSHMLQIIKLISLWNIAEEVSIKCLIVILMKDLEWWLSWLSVECYGNQLWYCPGEVTFYDSVDIRHDPLTNTAAAVVVANATAKCSELRLFTVAWETRWNGKKEMLLTAQILCLVKRFHFEL